MDAGGKATQELLPRNLKLIYILRAQVSLRDKISQSLCFFEMTTLPFKALT